MLSSEALFETGVGSVKEDPVFQRAAVFIYAYQAATCEKEFKVVFSSPFPQPPTCDPAKAFRLHQIGLEVRQKLSITSQKLPR